MAKRSKNLAALFADQKSRTIIIVTGVILVAMVIWGLMRLTSSDDDSSSASVSRVPNIASAPDPNRELSQQQTQNIKRSDQQRLEQAKQTNQSAIPTFLPQTQEQAPATTKNETKKDDSNTSSKDAANKLTSAQLSELNNQLTQSQQAVSQLQAQMAQQQAQAQELALQEAQAEQQKLTASMQNQAKAVMASWSGPSGTPQQTYVEGAGAKDKSGANGQAAGTTTASSDGTGSAATAAPAKKSPAVIKAGDISFGIINTEVNSDMPGPVLATIVSGKLKGAKLVGTLQQAPEITGTNGPTTVTLTFKTLSLPSLPNSISINAVAVDADTAQTALASEVDHHYMYRYGTLFASSFLSGYGQAITQSGSVSINNTDGSSTSFSQTLNPTQTFLAALGEVGTQLGDSLDDAVDRPNTIYVDSGTAVGLLFLSDVTIDSMSMG